MALQDLIGWLRYLEDLAFGAYSGAAKNGSLPDDLARFLERLAEDESLHYHLMGSAAELVRGLESAPAAAVEIDEQTNARIAGPLVELHKKTESGDLTEDDILTAVVASESSEWNDIFLYVMNTCAELSTEFQYMAAAIQAHERRIENYLHERGVELVGELRALPEIWQNNLLIVDDDPAVRRLFEKIASGLGRVTTAANGKAALLEIDQQFFNVIVSDVDMPVMDGISFMRRAIEKDPRLGSHFIICTADPAPQVSEAIEEYGVPLLRKPVTIQAFRETMQRVLAESL